MRASIKEPQPTIEYVHPDSDRDLLDNVLGILSTADWVTPSYALLRGGQSLAVYREEAAEADAILKQAEIPSWAWAVDGDFVIFNVADADTYRACRLLGLQPPAKLPPAWVGRLWWLFAALSGLGIVAGILMIVGVLQ